MHQEGRSTEPTRWTSTLRRTTVVQPRPSVLAPQTSGVIAPDVDGKASTAALFGPSLAATR